MRESLLDILVDPVSGTPLQLRDPRRQGDDIVEAQLRGGQDRSFPVRDSVPRFVLTEDRAQRQTEESFAFKWKQRDTYESEQMHAFAQEWLIRRYGFRDIHEVRDFFGSQGYVLDAGCGSGYSSGLFLGPDWQRNGAAQWVGTDISEAIDVARERLGKHPGTHFVQGDVLQLPFGEESFDVILSEGVLHHTPSTERALKALVPLLRRGGEILFYVYRRKGPVREFSDDYIRGVVSKMDPTGAWDALRPLTRLAEALSALKVEVNVPEDIPYLGIQAGKQDVQRLIYWHFLKLFWRDDWTFEQNNHINFDWYHPKYAHRQSEEEIRSWCDADGLEIRRFHPEESGFSVRAVRR